MRVFLRAPAADRMIVDPEGFSPGATPRLASARRQPGQAPTPLLFAANRPDNSTASLAAHQKKAAAWAASYSNLIAGAIVPRWLRDRTNRLIL